jgi:hypothetical protein
VANMTVRMEEREEHSPWLEPRGQSLLYGGSDITSCDGRWRRVETLETQARAGCEQAGTEAASPHRGGRRRRGVLGSRDGGGLGSRVRSPLWLARSENGAGGGWVIGKAILARGAW